MILEGAQRGRLIKYEGGFIISNQLAIFLVIPVDKRNKINRMPTLIKLKKGLDIKLVGQPEKKISKLPPGGVFSIMPPNFSGIVPKLLVKEGDEVKAGSPLFIDKRSEMVHYCSPVSGEVVEVLRGEKRRLLEIKILADQQIEYIDFGTEDLLNQTRQQVVNKLLQSGCWPFIRQRPYGIVAHPLTTPKSIFVSAFDSSPLAPDNGFIINENVGDFHAGLDVLKILSGGKVYLNIHAQNSHTAFTQAKGVEITTFSGPHPAGNVGVQIHHLDPINKGEIVWYANPQDVVIIGRLFTKGIFDATRIIAVTGSQVKHPQYYQSYIGCSVKRLLDDVGLLPGTNRIISGSVLSGNQLTTDSYVDFYDTQVTVISEGHEEEFLGWLSPGFTKFSMSHTFFSWLSPNRVHLLNTNLHGEERPFVVTGEYEKVFPMDIYPVQLLKAILIEDVELMEKLGIYEVVEEDFALCEVVCTSKIKSQQIISKGLEIMRKEFS